MLRLLKAGQGIETFLARDLETRTTSPSGWSATPRCLPTYGAVGGVVEDERGRVAGAFYVTHGSVETKSAEPMAAVAAALASPAME